MSEVNKALSKGKLLYRMMLADTETAGQMMKPPGLSAESCWQLVEDLSAAGYVEDAKIHEPHYHGRYNDDIEDVAPLLESIGFDGSFRIVFDPNPRTVNNSFITHRHTFSDQGDSGAYYRSCFEQVINPSEGLIVAYDNMSPLSHRGIDHLHDRMPCIKHWSDVAFLQWRMRTSLEFELKYVLRYCVQNDTTLDVANEIIPGYSEQGSSWLGVTYLATSREGQTLIGTPNGSGVAYLLIQHKHQLGRKVIGAVTVFRPVGYGLMMLFHVVDVDNAKRDERGE
ncbi:hypothetical protein IQ06DRAFT_305317 [Phaeosphaeriaceae sp. SRC1lsM3a]|nr:hypothetical protein IQ06DRAFT_305317 [Stagonospora sp. SRC1lsM3a]